MRPSALLAAAALVAAVAGCGGASSGALVVYSGRLSNLVGPLLEDFATETGIDIEVRYGDSADLAVLIDTEGDDSPAHVFLSQSPGAIGFLEGRERLVELPDTILEQVPERFRAASGRWVGLTGRVRVVVYNAEETDPAELPDSVFDLTDERYSGRIGVAPTNASFQDFVSAMRALRGDDETLEWLTALRENGVRIYDNNVLIVDAAARGEIDFGLVNHYYNERAKAEDPGTPTENHFLAGEDPGAVILMSSVGILDTAGDRRADAERFVDFLLSREAQQFFSAETFEFPLAAGVEPTVGLPPLDQVTAPTVDLSRLTGGLQRTRELIRDSGLESS